MKTTNTRKNRGKKSRNFKNTQKGGKRNKVVFIRKKTLRGKKQYTRRNRWKKNIHRGRQFLDVMVGGAQNASEPVKMSENMVIYTLLDDVEQPHTDTKYKKFFTMYEYNNLNMLIFFIIELKKNINLKKKSNNLVKYFSLLEEKFLNSLNTHNCQEFDKQNELTKLSKYDIFVYSFNKQLVNLFELVTHVSLPQKENTDIFDDVGIDLGLEKVNSKLQEYKYKSIYKLPNNSVGPTSTPQFISNKNNFIKDKIQENYRKKYAVFIEMERISIGAIRAIRAIRRKSSVVLAENLTRENTIRQYLENKGFYIPENNSSINTILSLNMTPENLNEDNFKTLIKFFNCNEKVIFPQIINVKNGADNVGTITPEISYLEFLTNEIQIIKGDKYFIESNKNTPSGSFKQAKFIKKKLKFKYKNNFNVSDDTSNEKEMDIIGLLLVDDDTNLYNIKEFKKMNDYYYNFSCEEKKYFCAPVLFGSFKDNQTETDVPIIINEYGGSDLISNKLNFNILATLIKESFKICKIFTEKKLIHRDIKHQNILYQEDKLKIIDFDLMISYKDFNETIEAGTPGYHLFHLFKITTYNDNDNSGFFEKKILSKYDLFSFFIVIQSYDFGSSGSEMQEKILDFSIKYPNINNFLKKYTTLLETIPEYKKKILQEAVNIKENYISRESLAIELTILFLFPPVEEFINIINLRNINNHFRSIKNKLNSRKIDDIIDGIFVYKKKIFSLIFNNFKNFEEIYQQILDCIEQTDYINYKFNLNVFNNNTILQNL